MYNNLHGFSDVDFSGDGDYGRNCHAHDNNSVFGTIPSGVNALGVGRLPTRFAGKAVYGLRAGKPYFDVGLFSGWRTLGQ